MTERAFPIPNLIKTLAPVLVAAFALAPGGAGAQNASPTLPESGVWIDDSGKGAVEIYICQEKANRLCGRIVWLKEPLNDQGVPKRDRYNPKPELQTRPICGLPVLGNLARDSDGGFDGGWIYDPKAGKSYSAAIRLSQRDQLVVTGYLGMRFMGKSFTWTRAPADLERCDGAPAAQPINNRSPAAPAVKGAGAASKASPSQSRAAATVKATAAQGGKTAAKTTATAKAPATGSVAAPSAQPTKKPAATATVAVPRPKPAQRPVKASGTAAATTQAPAQQPAKSPTREPVNEADAVTPDTAMSWSGQ